MKKKSISVGKFIRNNIMYGILIVLCVFFATQHKAFLSWSNLINMLNQSSYQIIVGVGIGMLMISGGIDLSVGYQISLIGVVAGWLMQNTSIHWLPVVLIAFVLGICMSLFNGLIVVKMKAMPFIITLATSYIFQGISYTITQTQTYRGFPDAFKWIGQGSIGPIPVAIILMVISVIVGSLILNKTYFGRYIYGVGSNREAVQLAGVNTDRLRLVIYGVAGFFVALGAIALIARTGSSASSMGPGTEFTIIAGGVLGGIKMEGGGGRMSSIVVGVLILTVLTNGMQLMQLGVYPQYIVKGFVLVLAICFDSLESLSAVRRAKLVKD